MPKLPDQDRVLAAQARMVAVVIALTMLFWMAAQWIGGEYGLPIRYVFLFDMAALAAMIWALYVTYQIWRKRKDE